MVEFNYQGGKGGQSKPHTPIETPNNLISTAYAKVLMAVAEGELAGTPTGRDIYLDGTPLINPDGSANFSGVKWEWRPGSLTQTHIPGIPSIVSEYGVGVEVTASTPWTRAITKKNLDAARVTLSWAALQKQEENGDTNGVVVKYVIEVATDGGAFETAINTEVNGKNNGQYQRTHRIELPKSNGGGWTIRVRRLTPDATSARVQDKIAVASFAEVTDQRQKYPHTAMLYVEFDARTFGGGNIPRVSVRTKGRIIQVPDNYDPESRTYTGVWSGVFKWAYTNNPAWVLYDILTNDRFGLGHKITPDMVDKWAMYEAAQYCDVMVDKGDGSGDKEPRHTCNIFIQEQNDAWTVLRDISNIFNAMTFWDGQHFVAKPDKEESLANLPVFSRSNVTNGRFDYHSADDKSIFTSALISYDDPENHYNTAIEATWERSQILRFGGDRQTSISAIGCTSRGEAQRRGKYVLLTNMFDRQVTFQTGLQGLNQAVLPGNLIHVADPLLSGAAFTGRVASVKTANREIILDRETDAKAGDVLYITRKNGVTEGRTVLRASGNSVTVSVSYTEVPQPNAVWYLETSDLKSQLFRVTKVTSPGNGLYEISGVEYNESKYGAIDSGARLETRPINRVPPSLQAPPASVSISSRTYVEQTMAVTTMTISWPQTVNATSYEVQWRVGDGDWVNLGFTGATEVEVKGIYAGNYTARVRARNAINVASIWTVSPMTSLAGKTGAPPPLASLITSPMFFGIRLDWKFSPGSEDLQKTEIRYSETTNFENSVLLGDFSYPTDYHEMHGLKAGQRFWFWARTQDRTGNYSVWSPLSTDVGITGSSLINDNGAYNDYLAEMINETMLDKSLYDRIELIDGNGPGSVNERLETVNDRIDQTNNDLNNAVSDLEDQIANITDALVYDPTKTYSTGDIVRVGSKLYQAQQDVPINTTPPNINYWKDVGTILESANAVVNQVNVNTQKIEEVDGKVTATANQITGLQAMWRDDNGEGDLQDALNGWGAAAKYGVEVKVRAKEDEALAQRITTLSAEVGNNKASIATLETVVANNNSATAERISTLQTSVNNNSSKISTLETSVTNLDSTTASSLQLVNSRIDGTNDAIDKEISDREASVGSEATTRANADIALGVRIDTTEAAIGENTANIQQVEEAQVSLEESVARITTNISSIYVAGRDDNDEGALQDALGNWKTSANYGLEVKTRTNENEAMTQRVEILRADFNTANSELSAAIKNEALVRATADAAISRQVETVQATAGDNTAAIQETKSALATTDGKVNSAWTLKIEAQSNGDYVAAGIGLGIENGPAGLQSQFLVRADRFAVVSGLNGTKSAPFVVTGGQVFINDALINKATITNAIIGSTLTSTAQTNWGGPVMEQNFNSGTITVRKATEANTYTVMDQTGTRVYVAGVLRVRMGSW